jgi:hypothetical protein
MRLRPRLVAIIPGLALAVWLPAQALRAQERPLPLRVWTFRLPGTELGLDVADMDGDGKKDLAIAHMSGPHGLERSVSVWLHGPPGRPRFSPEPAYRVSVPPDACAFLAGDFDPVTAGGELVFLCPSRVVLMRRTGELVDIARGPGFYDYPEDGGLPVWDLAPDLDGDGRQELLVPTKDGYDLFARAGGVGPLVLKCKLAVPSETRFGPAFESALLNRFLTATSRLRRLVVADLDGDGRKDLVAYRDKGLARFHQRPDGTFPLRPDEEQPLQVVQQDQKPGQEAKEGSEAFANVRLDLEDVDGDGRADLVVTKTLGEIGMFETLRTQQLVFRGGPKGFDESRPDVLLNIKGVSADPVFIDWNGDGRRDLIVSSYRMDLFTNVKRALVEALSINYMIYLARGKAGEGWFGDEPDVSIDVDVELKALEKRGGAQPVDLTADLDGDGTRDMVRRSPEGALLVQFGGTLKGMFGGRRPGFREGTLQIGVPRTEPPRAIDLDGDGKHELVLEPFGGDDEAARIVRVVGVEQ